jgi:hypothetical protein
MATSPVFHDEPLISIRAAMLFPNDMAKAENYAAWCLVKGSKGRASDVGAIGVDGLHKLALGALLHSPGEADRKALAGAAVGAVVTALLALISDDPGLASWNSAVALASAHATKARGKTMLATSPQTLRNYMSEFALVLHLWGAWRIRGARWRDDPSVKYTLPDDVQMFLLESETILERLRKLDYQQRHESSRSHYLMADSFQVAPSWEPPSRLPGWPNTGCVPAITLDRMATDLPALRKSGRPHKNPL